MEKKFGWNEMFTCEACGEKLHHTCFGRKKVLPSGHLGICKQCLKENPRLKSKEHREYEEAAVLKDTSYRAIHRLKALLFVDQWKLDHACAECESPFNATLPAHMYKLYRARPDHTGVKRASVVVQRYGSREELVRALEASTVLCWKCYEKVQRQRMDQRRLTRHEAEVAALDAAKITGVFHAHREGIKGQRPMTTIEKQKRITELETLVRSLPDGKKAKYEPKAEEVEEA